MTLSPIVGVVMSQTQVRFVPPAPRGARHLWRRCRPNARRSQTELQPMELCGGAGTRMDAGRAASGPRAVSTLGCGEEGVASGWSYVISLPFKPPCQLSSLQSRVLALYMPPCGCCSAQHHEVFLFFLSVICLILLLLA